MSVIQNNESELRYLKRKNLDQEARIIGNYYRDIIRSYGCDVIYNKLDTSEFENFNHIIDQNAILLHAYGYNITPDYSCKAKMISYMDVEQDIFQLQKYGLNPNTDINFYFDSNDFACALAEQYGQYQEYKIKETTITCEIPDCTTEKYTNSDRYIADDVFPYGLGVGYAENFECFSMCGKLSAEIPAYSYDTEYSVMCTPYDETELKVNFNSNNDLYKSIKHSFSNKNKLKTLILLRYSVSKVLYSYDSNGNPLYKSILNGKLTGSVLFYNLYQIGKYLEKIHPNVGDIITIDFPDNSNAEKYEITDCYDKSLAQDGISPLLHKYIWKCKARRYINNYDDIEESTSDKRQFEKQVFTDVVKEKITKKLVDYPNNEDEVYGGQDREELTYDSNIIDNNESHEYEILDQTEFLDILRFDCGSRLVTSGFDLYFLSQTGETIKISLNDQQKFSNIETKFEKDLDFIKATDNGLYFVNISGETYKIVESETASEKEIQMCLTALMDKTFSSGNINPKYSNFYKFKNTRTILWSTPDHLYCRLENNGQLFIIA